MISATSPTNERIDRLFLGVPGTYCMPDQGVALTPKQLLVTTEELKQLIDVFISLGVTKVRLTGGEPLLRKDIIEIVGYIRSKPSIQKIGLYSNSGRLSMFFKMCPLS